MSLARSLPVVLLAALSVGCPRGWVRRTPPMPPAVTVIDVPRAVAADTAPNPPPPPREPAVLPPTAAVAAEAVPPTPVADPVKPAIVPVQHVEPAVVGGNGGAEPRRSPDVEPPARTPGAIDPVRFVIDEARKRYESVPDFETRLVKREVVKGKPLPAEEILMRFRREPVSVYLKVVGKAGRGREALYVRGRFGDQMHVVVGEGDSLFKRAGDRVELDPDGAFAMAKSRYRIYEAGFDRTLSWLDRCRADEACTVKLTEGVKRDEFAEPLTCLEVRASRGPNVPVVGGGVRRVYFDPNPNSPAYRLPVLISTCDAKGVEVEYYCFTGLKVPSGWADADWHPDRLGK